MEMKCFGPVEMAEEQLPIAIDYLESSQMDLRRVRREKKKLKKLLEKVVAKEKHIKECISSCELEIEGFEKILERGV